MRFRTREYAKEEEEVALARQAAAHHPFGLSPSPSTAVKGSRLLIHTRASSFSSSTTSSSSLEVANSGHLEDTFLDPLRATSVQHPLTSGSSLEGSSSRFSNTLVCREGRLEEQFEAAMVDWDVHRTFVLQRFTTSDTIKVSVNLDILSRNAKGSLTSLHLKELNDHGTTQDEKVEIISQEEYVTRLRELNEEIAHAWMDKERVAALRLSVKAAKLLSDTSIPKFYPILFILVTDIMETMGKLVWKRIKGKSEVNDSGELIKLLPDRFSAHDIRQEAKDTCSNWFFKIGSIRELLPRIYLEIAILHCMHFLEKDLPVAAFERLSMMIRGLADPLAAAYAHLYLARKGQSVFPSESGFLIRGLEDYLLLFRRVLSGEFDKTLAKSGLDKQSYTSLVEPLFDISLHYLCKHASMEEQLSLMQVLCKQHDSLASGKGEVSSVSVVIYYLLKHLPASLVASQSLELSRIIKSSGDLSKGQYLIYKLFGLKLCECNPPRELRLPILNDVWKVVLTYSNLLEYLTVADVFVEYILNCCTESELIVLLRDTLRHSSNSEVSEEAMKVLESIVLKIMASIKGLTCLLTMPHFVDIIDIFVGDTRNLIHKEILSNVAKENQALRDPVLRHFVFELSKSLYNSLDSLSSEDDQRQIARLIARFVQLVDFGLDLEQHLSFLVDCRGAFSNMDLPREMLVHVSNRLAMTTVGTMKKTTNLRSVDFVKCCVTFNEITIPSIRSASKRVHLYLGTAEVAAMNGLVSHTEGLVRSSITSLEEIDTSEIEFLCGLKKLCSFLIVIPGHSEHDSFLLLRSVVDAINNRSWVKETSEVEALCGVIQACSALSQETLPYHLNSPDIIGNDELFSGEIPYVEELVSIAAQTLEKVVVLSTKHGCHKLEAWHAFQVFVSAFEMGNKDMAEYCSLLLKVAKGSLPKNFNDLEYYAKKACFVNTGGLKV